MRTRAPRRNIGAVSPFDLTGAPQTMEIPTELIKDGREATAALKATMDGLEAKEATQLSDFKTMFIDFLPQIIAVACVSVIVGLVFGVEIGRHFLR
jgi:hypothetical protein